MPPHLFDVLDACQTIKVWKTASRPAEPDLAGLRDRALLLVGFIAALRRSELAGLATDRIAEHPNGLVLTLPRSKSNQTGEHVELVVLPRAGSPGRCPVTTLQAWLDSAGISSGPVFRPVSKGNRALPRPLHPESVNSLSQAAVRQAGLDDPASYSATACEPASSPTPTCAAPPTGPSPTKPATGHWPPSAPTSASTRPGRTTPPPSSAYSLAQTGRTTTGTATYEIRGAGHLDDHWAATLGELTLVRLDDGTTSLTGPVIDHAQLHGVLARIRDLGVPLRPIGITGRCGHLVE